MLWQQPFVTTVIVSVLDFGFEVWMDPHRPWDTFRIVSFALASAGVYAILRVLDATTKRQRRRL